MGNGALQAVVGFLPRIETRDKYQERRTCGCEVDSRIGVDRLLALSRETVKI
jgi:hypothetical protein